MMRPAQFSSADAPPWPADRWGTLLCRAAWDETQDVRSFLLVPEGGMRLAFEAGQFLTFRAQLDGEAVERSYTISSSAALGEAVTITVKRKPGGRMSGHLHDALRPGARIEAFGAAGGFGLPPDARGRKLLLISAGSGVTPLASILATAADRGEDLDALYLHAARRPADAIFADALPRLARRLPRLEARLSTSRDGAGRLDAARLRAEVPELGARVVLCCGPEGFMAMVREAAREAGVAGEDYLEESFAFDAADAPPAAAAGIARQVTFARSGRSFAVAPGQTILQAARAAGIPMAFSCAKGSCGTCKCRKLSGSVAMTHQGGIRQREIDAGFILPCSSRPETDVTLDR